MARRCRCAHTLSCLTVFQITCALQRLISSLGFAASRKIDLHKKKQYPEMDGCVVNRGLGSHARWSERATLARCASRRNAGPGNWAINWPQPPLDAVLRRRPNSKVEWQYCPKTRTALS